MASFHSKLRLIEENNPNWHDLSEDWIPAFAGMTEQGVQEGQNKRSGNDKLKDRIALTLPIHPMT